MIPFWNYRYLFLLIVLLMLVGCTNSNTASQSIRLSLANEDNRFQVTDYQVFDIPYKDSRSHGSYQIHLLDNNSNIIQKIGFDGINTTGIAEQNRNIDFEVAIPLKKDLHRVIIYSLDGRSGHDQLNKDDPMLSWKVPATVLNKIKTASN